jgi:O-acetyl-ADP-ribose deacetylase (regulator of RNase III)
MRVVQGDLLEAKEEIIAHGCNCQGVMGSGVAKVIKEKWPEAFERYVDDLSNFSTKLGDATIVFTEEGKCVFNLLTQNNYGTVDRMVNYAALITSLQFAIVLYHIETGKNVTSIAIPKIGAGLGGGNWEIIHQLLEDFEKMYNVEFVLYII